MLSISAEEKAKLKGRGFIAAKDGKHFTARIVVPNGILTEEQLTALSDAAKKYGNGKVAMTVRMSIELQGVEYENINELEQAIIACGLSVGGTGPLVRPIVSCKGTVCPHGIMDTHGLGEKLYNRFYLGWHEIKLPAKFKIGIGGCPNNCIKPSLNDIGIMGQRVSEYDQNKCKSCNSCAVVNKCPAKAASSDIDGKPVIDKNICTRCGKCIDLCPFGSFTETKRGFKVFFGGFWGKMQKSGEPIDRVFSEEEVMELIEKALLLFIENGKPGERFARMIDRIGFEAFKEQLLSGNVTDRKESILNR